MSRETELLWRTKLDGNFEDHKGPYLTEHLYGHIQLTREQAELYPETIKFEREHHRRSISEKVTEALYKGWLPYEMEWWEGYVGDDPWAMKDYIGLVAAMKRGYDIYHFWTRIRFAALRNQPMLKRNPKPVDSITLETVSPQGLR